MVALKLKLALRPWRHYPGTQALTSLALTAVLFLFGMTRWLNQTVDTAISGIQGRQVMTAYLDPALGEKEGTAIADTIRTQLGSSANRVEFQAQEKFLGDLANAYPQLSEEIQQFGNEAQAIAPNFVSIQGRLTDGSIEQVRKIPGVESVSVSKTKFRSLVENLQASRAFTRWMSMALLLALASLLLLVGKLNARLNHETARMIGQLGGSDLEAKMPGLLNLASLGALSGASAALLWRVGASGLAAQARALSPIFERMSAPSHAIYLVLPLLGAAAGYAMGLLTQAPAKRIGAA